MTIADINQVEQRLSEVIMKERKEAIGYSIVIVLCMPFFLFVAGCIFFLIFILMLHSLDIDHETNANDIYMFFNVFLALMIGMILRHTFSPDSEQQFNISWIVAVIIFLVLLYLTYGLKFPQKDPLVFGIVYAAAGFIILGLLGRVYFDLPISEYEQYDEDSNAIEMIHSFILLLAGLIFRAYGEMFSSSWLWSPPKEDKMKMCAWFLLLLAKEKIVSAQNNQAERPVLNILFRLKLIEKKEDFIRLTSNGLDLVDAA